MDDSAEPQWLSEIKREDEREHGTCPTLFQKNIFNENMGVGSKVLMENVEIINTETRRLNLFIQKKVVGLSMRFLLQF